MRVFLLASVAACVLGGSAAAETLHDALAAAYQSNPELEAQRAALRATDEGVATALSGYRPTLEGQASISYSRRDSQFFATEDIPERDPVTNEVVRDSNGNPVIAIPKGGQITSSTLQGQNRQYQAQLTQPIFRGFRTQSGLRQARSEVFAGRAQLDEVEQRTLLNTITAYLDVVRDEAVLRLNDGQVEVLRRQLEASQDRFRVGEITRTDVAQSEARLAVAVSNRIAADAALTVSREAFRRVVGKAPETLEPPPPLPELPASLEEAIAIAQEESPTLNAARHVEEAAQYAVSSAKGALLPSLNATASVFRQEAPFNFGTFNANGTINNYAAGAQLTVPFYRAGGEYAAVRQAKQVRSQRMLEIAAAERQVVESVRNAWDQLRAARASIKSNQSSMRANEIALEGVRQEAVVGSRTTIEVLNAEQELLNSRVELVRSERDEYVAASTLLAAIGRLGARDLSLNVDYYDPGDHYRSVKWKPFGFGSNE
ncbi:MAG: TolC family outer membrane protein [Pseudomonadota bacterium]